MLGAAIQQPEYEVFAKPPLKAMLGQVKFPPILRIADMSALAGFQESLRESWPEFAQEQQVTLMLGGPGAPPAQAGSQQLFRFTSSDKAWSAVLAPDGLTLEATTVGPYSSYDDFGKRFRDVWGTLVEHFRPAAISRQGLRYVDHLEGSRDPARWTELINPELIGPLAGALAEGLEQSVSEFRFRYDESVLVFKHGIVRAGLESTEGYLLDYDYFTDVPSQEVELESLMERFDRYHDAVYALFRWSITDEAVNRFRDAG